MFKKLQYTIIVFIYNIIYLYETYKPSFNEKFLAFPFLVTRPCKVQGWVEIWEGKMDRYRANIRRCGVVRSMK